MQMPARRRAQMCCYVRVGQPRHVLFDTRVRARVLAGAVVNGSGVDPFLQADSHGVADLLADDFTNVGLDRQLVGAVAHNHK